MSSVPYPTVLHETDEPRWMDRSQNQIINITNGERNIPVSFSLKPNCEALVFHMEYVTDKNHFNDARRFPMAPIKYVQAILKYYDHRFVSNSQFIFHALDWIEKEAVWNSINIA